jgi:putative ABC transport system permease protein
MHGFVGDLRLAARRLRATPFFLVFAVLSLAVGVSITIASYAVVETLFWMPLGIPEPERVVVIADPPQAGAKIRHAASVTAEDFAELRSSQRTLTHVAAAMRFGATLVTPSGGDSLSGEAVSGEYFSVVGISAAIGRTIQAQDDERSAPVIVLSDRLWRMRFGADPNVVGTLVRLGEQPFEIVGVAPRDFHGVLRGAGRPRRAIAWIPLRAMSLLPGAARDTLGSRALTAVGRLGDETAITYAAGEIPVIARRLDAVSPRQVTQGPNGAPVTIPRQWDVVPVDAITYSSDRFPWLLLVIASMVLLVACTNLANLMMARGTTRQHEFGVRRALGASRWRLVREQCAESVLIALIGGAAALAATRWLLATLPGTTLVVFGEVLPFEPRLSVSVLLFAAGALLLSLLTFGLEPAFQLTRKPLTSDLASEAGTGSVRRARRQRALIRWQVAICTSFFLIASILGRVIIEEAAHDPGVDVDRLAVAVVGGMAEWDEARVRRAARDVIAAAREEPGLEAVAVSTGLPFGVVTSWASITTPDKPFAEGPRPGAGGGPGAYFIPATDDIFRTLGIPLVAGRPFDGRDIAGSAPVAIVSEETARTLFRTLDVVGRQLAFRLGRTSAQTSYTVTIVGVAGDTDTGRLLSANRNGVLYVPFTQHHVPGNIVVTARTPDNPASAAQSLQAAIRRTDPDLSAASYGPASVILGGLYVIARAAGVAAAALGALTLVLSMIGLYGVQSQAVAQRTREVGVRAALGATGRQIKRMVLADGFRPVVQGLALGLMLGSLARLTLRAVLVAPIDLVDPIALIVVPIPLGIAAFLACRIPASRAARVSPSVALRQQ